MKVAQNKSIKLIFESKHHQNSIIVLEKTRTVYFLKLSVLINSRQKIVFLIICVFFGTSLMSCNKCPDKNFDKTSYHRGAKIFIFYSLKKSRTKIFSNNFLVCVARKIIDFIILTIFLKTLLRTMKYIFDPLNLTLDTAYLHIQHLSIAFPFQVK